MPVRVCKIKSEPQSSDQSNLQIKSIQDINPDDVINFADHFQLFKKYYPDDPESEVADKIFAMMEVLEHFRNNVINSPFLSKRDQLSRCRSAFTKALSQHPTSALQARVSKNQLTPSAYLAKFEDIKKLLDSTFANVDIEEMIHAFNDARTEINQLVQTLSQIHQKLQSRDKEFHESYAIFQKVKKTFVTQVNQLREYHQSRRCTSLVTKNNFLMEHFKTLCKILNPKQSNIKDKGISYFNEITKCFIEIKIGLLGYNITQKMDSLLKKLDNKKDNQSFSEDGDDDDEKSLSSRSSKIETHKSRNRRNTRTNSNDSRQAKKNVKNSASSKDENNYYEYEEEEEEEDVVVEEEEEEEEEVLEEEEEEEEEEEIEEVVVNKRSRRSSSSNSSNSDQNKKVDNRRTRSSARSNASSSSSSSSSSSNQRSSLTNRANSSSSASNSANNSRKARSSRSRTRSETSSSNDNRSSKANDQSSSSSSSAAAAAANKRGRSRSSGKNDANTNSNSNSNSSSAASSSNSNSNANNSGRGRRGQAVGIAARYIETSLSNGNNSSQRGRSNGSNESNQFSSRRTRRRRGANDDSMSDNDEDGKNKSHANSNSSQSTKESGYNTRSSSRGRDKDGKESQSFSSSSGSQAKGRTRSSGNAASEIETKAQAQERKLVCNQIEELTKPLLEIIGRDSFLNNENDDGYDNENDFPNRIFNPLRELYRSEHPTESGLHSAFSKSCKEFKLFLEKMDFELFPIKLFFMIHEIEVYKINHNVNNKNIDQLITSISNLSEKLTKYQQLQFIEMINIELLEQLSNVIKEESSDQSDDQKMQNYGKDPLFLMNIFEDMFNVLTPIICLLKTILPYNLHIKTNKLTRTCEYLYIPYKNYLDRQSTVYSTMHLHQYNPVPFKFIKSNQDFDSFISNLCKEIECNGIQIVNNLTSQEFNCLNIIVPKINELLRNMQNNLFMICANITDDGLNQFSSNLMTKIYEIGKILEIEKSVCRIKNSYASLESVVDFHSLFAMIKTFRNIHFLFIALDGRNVISYSNALNITYARMFAERICEYDILENQFLCAPIEPSKVIAVRDILNVSQNESMEEKLKSSFLVRLKSFEYFPMNYFVTLFNIENIKAPVLKASSSSLSTAAASAAGGGAGIGASSVAPNPANSLYPPELSDLVFAARLKNKKNDESHLNDEDEIELVKHVFGIDKDFNSFDHKFENNAACIRALSDIYLNILEMIVIRDQIFIIPSSLSNFLALRSESSDFAEKLSVVENFNEFVLIFNGTFHLNILSLINSIIKEIESISIPQEQEMPLQEGQQQQQEQQQQEQHEQQEKELSVEASEKVIAYLLLMIMKRGYLSTVTVSQFVKFITNEENKLHESFIQNENLMKSVLDLCKVILFIDIHDKIIESIPSISNVSILRNINLGLFSTSLSRSLLFLNSTTVISITNQTPFTLSDLSELNKYGKYVLSNINEVDRYPKDEMVEALKNLYQILPTSSTEISNELSEDKIKSIDFELRDKHYLKVSCLNLKLEIDDFIRFQSDPKKRAMKMTSPIIPQLLNPQSTNSKNIIQFCIFAFDVPKNCYMDASQNDNRSYVGSIALKQQKRTERLKKIDELLELKEMQFVASSDSLLIPIPCSLLSAKQQEFMANYYQKLQEEREELVIKEKVFQEYLEKKEFLLQQIQEQSVKRKELVEKFYSARERLKQVARKAQKQEEMNRRRQEKEKSNQSFNSFSGKNGSNNNLFQFENDAILASQHNKNHLSVQNITKDLAMLEQRTRISLETNRSFKKMIEDLNKKYEDRQESAAKAFSSSSSPTTTTPSAAAAALPATSSMQQSPSTMQSDLNEFDVGDSELANIDEFVKNALIEMNLASETTFKEIEKTANEIRMLEEGAADEEAAAFMNERAKDVQQSSGMSPSEKEALTELYKEIMALKNERDKLLGNGAGK